MTIDALIDKQDSFEIIRDQIAAILAIEVSAQMALAITAGKDPALWDLKIYEERSSPWEQWLNNLTDEVPIINVWYDNSNVDKRASNTISRQKVTGIFNIDCYGFGQSEDNGVGHKAGDEQAAFTAQRAVRLVRNILMADIYQQLNLRGLVWDKMTQSINMFQPQINSNQVQNIVGGRIQLSVDFNELSPQQTYDNLELLSAQVCRKEDGSVYFDADYTYV